MGDGRCGRVDGGRMRASSCSSAVGSNDRQVLLQSVGHNAADGRVLVVVAPVPTDVCGLLGERRTQNRCGGCGCGASVVIDSGRHRRQQRSCRAGRGRDVARDARHGCGRRRSSRTRLHVHAVSLSDHSDTEMVTVAITRGCCAARGRSRLEKMDSDSSFFLSSGQERGATSGAPKLRSCGRCLSPSAPSLWFER